MSGLTTQREQVLRGYCCLVLRRYVVEPHELEEGEAQAFLRDARRVSRAVQKVTAAVKMNLEVRPDPRWVGDRLEVGPVDARRGPVVSDEEELGRFVSPMRVALDEA